MFVTKVYEYFNKLTALTVNLIKYEKTFVVVMH